MVLPSLEFGARWLGIWSSEDEAISGLRATTHLAHSQIVPRLRIPSEPVFESDRIIRFWKPFVRLLLAPVYNGLFGPLADSFVLSRLTRAAQGNNRIGCTLVDVSETPIPMESFRGERLPQNLDEDLIAHTNGAIRRRSEQVLAQARTSRSQFAWGSGSLTTTMQDMHSQLAGDELVHTSYLLARPVRDLLCLRIANSQNHPSGQDSHLPAGTPASIDADGQSGRRGLRAAGWLLLATVFVMLIIVETLNGELFFVLPAALILTGAAVATTPFRFPCQTAGKCAFRTALAAGSALILSGLCFGIAPQQIGAVLSGRMARSVPSKSPKAACRGRRTGFVRSAAARRPQPVSPPGSRRRAHRRLAGPVSALHYGHTTTPRPPRRNRHQRLVRRSPFHPSLVRFRRPSKPGCPTRMDGSA